MNELAKTSQSDVSLFGWKRPAGDRADSPAIEVVGVPSDSGNGTASGARFGPEAIRRASMTLPPPGVDGVDLGDVAGVHGCDWADLLVRTQRIVEQIAARGSLPVVLGGDHGISHACVAALSGAGPLNIVWFDAHTDFCAWQGGNWHNHKQVLRRIATLPHVVRILQIGHRGVTYDDESSRSEKMIVLTARAATELPVEALLEHLPKDQPVYISLDVDAIDPIRAPGTGHPVPGGVSPEWLGNLAHAICTHRRVVGLDVMEVNPLLDSREMTSVVAAAILSRMISAVGARPANATDVQSAASLPD